MDRNIEDEQAKQAIFIVRSAIDLAGKRGVSASILMRELAAAAAIGQVQLVGSEMAARCFRELGDKIESGAFDAIGTDQVRH
ncbi:hypothetical protein [Dongia deserti]|uniref:hypothetical protein n=1 Tax=Dongia deserti TaxID=2268030 RepID=UPI000E657420|nr:hypothetical protein [Dongia deserti]